MPLPSPPEIARQIDADSDALADVGVVGVDQPLARCRSRSASALEQRMAAAEADLRQPRAFAHQHRKGARANLGIERPVIAGLDAVEAARLVGDHAGEDVEPAGRALRIGGGGDVVRQRQAFQQAARCRRSRSPAPRRRRARISCSLSSSMRCATVRAAGQKACAHAVGDLAEPQIEARRLDLVGHEVGRAAGSRRLAASAAIMRSGRMPLSSIAEGKLPRRSPAS